MEKNKTGKYLKYAIGEIILVVVGILIALGINNWHNNNIERSIEHDILNEILVNLNSDLQNINYASTLNEKFAKHNQLVYEHLKNKTALTDSLKYYYSYLYGYGNFQPIPVAYENLKSRGVHIVKNSSLRKKISELYEFDYANLSKNIRQAAENIQTQHSNQINERLITKTSYSSAEPVDLIALQNDIQFQETLKSVVFARNWTNGNFAEGKKKIIEVKTAIEEELNDRNK